MHQWPHFHLLSKKGKQKRKKKNLHPFNTLISIIHLNRPYPNKQTTLSLSPKCSLSAPSPVPRPAPFNNSPASPRASSSPPAPVSSHPRQYPHPPPRPCLPSPPPCSPHARRRRRSSSSSSSAVVLLAAVDSRTRLPGSLLPRSSLRFSLRTSSVSRTSCRAPSRIGLRTRTLSSSIPPASWISSSFATTAVKSALNPRLSSVVVMALTLFQDHGHVQHWQPRRDG